MAKKNKLPSGIILIIVLLSIAILSSLVALFSGKEILFGLTIPFPLSTLFSIAYLVVLVFLIYGISRLKYWSWVLSILFFTFNILNTIFSIFIFPNEIVTIVGQPFLITSGIIGIIAGLLVISYLLLKKPIFLGKKDKNKKIDSKFIITYIVFFTISLFILIGVGISAGVDFITNQVEFMEEMQDLNYSEDKELCFEREGYTRDICIYGALVSNLNTTDAEKITLCQESQTDLGYEVCFITIAGITENENYCSYLKNKESIISCKAHVQNNPKLCNEIKDFKLQRNCRNSVLRTNYKEIDFQ
jgi:hypothetical protein